MSAPREAPAQARDMAHSLSLSLENSGDMRSRGALAQVDLATYYDKVPMQRCGAAWKRRAHPLR